jgi:hypothetical protein
MEAAITSGEPHTIVFRSDAPPVRSESRPRLQRPAWVKPTPRSKHNQRDFARDIARTEHTESRDRYSSAMTHRPERTRGNYK